MANANDVTKSINAWSIKQIQLMQETLVDRIKADTPVKTGRAQAGTQSTKVITALGETGVIRNEVPYIGWLEFGSDTVAPSAMFRNNLNRVGK